MSFSKWREVDLEEAVDILGDGLHGTPNYDENGDYYFINGNNLDGEIIIDNKTKRVGYEEYIKHKKELNDRTIFVSINGTLGNVAVYKGEKVILGKSACYFNVKKDINKEFIKYIMLSSKFKNYLYSHATGTTIKNMGLKQMRGFKFNLPPEQEQKAIAHVLSTVDEKIEANNQINKTLEDMAKAIFKQWFVDFEFPNEDGEPYKSSGGDMVESELGMIPKGWDVVKFDRVLDSVEAGNRPKGGAGNLTEGIPSIGAENIIGLGEYDFSKEKYVSKEYYKKMRKGIVKPSDVLLYKDGAQLGRKTMFMDGFPHEECCINSHVFILRVKKPLTQAYLYFWIDQDWMTQKIVNLNANSAQPGINKVQVKSLKLLVPRENVVSSFDEIAKSLLKKLFANSKENIKLKDIRDIILPKLMSGEIRVPLES